MLNFPTFYAEFIFPLVLGSMNFYVGFGLLLADFFA